MSIAILEKDTDTILAEAEGFGPHLLQYEGNLYFAPEAARTASLQVTARTYTCPYKGTCHWVDFRRPDGRTVRDVAWVYTEPKAGHEAIKGRYGFYAGDRGATRMDEEPAYGRSR